MTRVVFMGTPEFALPSLQALLDNPALEVVGVVTQPDRPAGRGRQLRPSPTKALALAHGVEVFQPETLRRPEAQARLAAWSPALIVVAAFGQLLRPALLALPPWGCVNVHASLLPRWRGAAPIQAALRAGDAVTGVTLMKMDAGLDTGPILAQRETPIGPRETGASLGEKLAALGGQIVAAELPRYLAGEITPRPQPRSGVTLAPRLRKADGEIDWRASADEIDRQVRAYYPWPGAYTLWAGKRLKIISGTPRAGRAEPGLTLKVDDEIAVGAGAGLFVLSQVQPAGKSVMAAVDFARGARAFIGARLG